MSADPFAAKRHDARRRRWRRIGLAILAAVVVGLLVWVVWFSSLLAVDRVTVHGETTLTDDQVREVAEVPSGRPLARVDTVAIEGRVATMARVRGVVVERAWPRTIRIRIEEREAVGWTTVDGGVRGVDEFGVDFRGYGSPPKGLTEMRVTAPTGRQRQQTVEAVARVVHTLADRDDDLRRQVRYVSAQTPDSIVLTLTKGRSITWGSAGDAGRKLKVLRPLLELDARVYDVSAPDQPTTKK